MNDKNEPTIVAVLTTWAILLSAAFIAASWQLIAVCLAWVAIVQFAKHFIYWFSH